MLSKSSSLDYHLFLQLGATKLHVDNNNNNKYYIQSV